MTMLTKELLKSFEVSISDFGEAETLPSGLYTSEEFLTFEKEAIFSHEWLAVGRSDRIPEPGDWFTVTLLEEPLIVVRDKEARIRCLSAVCRHRAMAVCEGKGNNTTFKCPYHHWIYALDGRLLGAPAMERTEEFEKVDWGLPQLKVEVWQGFIFVNHDQDAAPLGPTMARYDPYLEHYDIPDAVCPGTFTLEGQPWNWKVMFENFNDGYHANRLHQYLQDFAPSSMTSFPVPWDDSSNVIFREAGYTHIDGGFNATHKVIMPIFPKLTEEERTRSTFALIPPTLCFGTAADQCFFFLVRPTSPRRSTSRSGTCFTLRRSTVRCSMRSSNSPTRGCRFLFARTPMPRPRCSVDWPPGMHPAVGTPGRRRVIFSSIAGWYSGTSAIGPGSTQSGSVRFVRSEYEEKGPGG